MPIRKRLRSALLPFAVLTIPLWALSSTEAQTSHTGTADSASAPLSFDAVSIKRNESHGNFGSLAMKPDGDGFKATNVPLRFMVQFAYEISREDLLLGAPEWSRTERYDVNATIANADLRAYRALPEAARRAMLQSMLAERCSLKAHTEARELPVYALTVSRHETKLHDAGHDAPLEPVPGPDGKPTQELHMTTSVGLIEARQIPLRALAVALSNEHAGRPVVDRTGLDGVYDLTLRWTPDTGASETTSGDAEAPPDLFTAIEEQLGLKLIATKAGVDVLVVDYIERPTPN